MKKRKYVSPIYIDSLPKLLAPNGYVYVIQDVDVTKRCKIGKTNYPARRLKEFGVIFPFKFEVLLVKKVDDAFEAESFLHSQFQRDRTRGEWFNLSDSQLHRILEWDPSSIIMKRRKRPVPKSNLTDTETYDVLRLDEDWTDTSHEEMDFEHDELLDEDSFESFVPEGDIEDSIMMLENAAGIDLSGVILQGMELWGRDFSDAILWGADLSYANLAGSDFTGADLTDTDLTGANLTGAILTECNLTGAKLNGANLAKANLKKADLTTADLSKAILNKAMIDQSTTLPNGTNWSAQSETFQLTV